MSPAVSIITPAYNLERYVEETGRSIFAQTIADWEWIIVDDGSTDNTVNLVEKWRDPRIKILRSHHIGNLSMLRNMGAKTAQGQYLAFVDGDDVLAPEKLEKQLALLRSNHLKWGFTAANNFFETSQKVEKRRLLFDFPAIIPAETALKTLLETNYICISSVMMHTASFWEIGGFEEAFQYSEDKNLWLRAAAQGWTVGYCSEALLQYRIRPSSLYQSNTLKYLFFNFVAYASFKEQFPQQAKQYASTIKRYYSNNHKSIFAHKFALKQGGAFAALAKAIWLNPFEKNNWILLIQALLFKEKLRNNLQKRLQ